MTHTILEELIEVLERRKAAGVRTLPVSPALLEGLGGTPAAPPRSSRREAAPVRPAPARRAAEPTRRPTAPGPSAAAPASVRESSPVVAPPAAAGLDWDALSAAVASCRGCVLHEGRTQAVFGDGDRNARLMFIGEGPGRDEDLQGLPFVGAAGQLLDRMISAMQLRRRDVYIANIVKCRPPKNRNPEPGEAAVCMPYLERQIELVAPEAIVLLGAVPLRFLMRAETGITRARGTWMEYRGIPVMPTYHPAYLIRVPARKREAWEDLQQVMRRLGMDPEKTVRGARQR